MSVMSDQYLPDFITSQTVTHLYAKMTRNVEAQ